jgi:hypothetical protein
MKEKLAARCSVIQSTSLRPLQWGACELVLSWLLLFPETFL